MRLHALFIALMFMLPGCFADDEEISFNGRDLGGTNTYKFILEDAEGPLWSLEDQEGKVVVLAFIFTRCDNTCPVTSQNIKMVKESLSEDELYKTSFVSVTVDWRHDSPSKLRNYTADFGYDWPHLTGAKQYLDPIYENYGVFPYEEDDNSSEGYTVAHPSPTYILDTEGKGRVVWSDYDFPTDLFLEDLRTVLEHY
jgi:protein SCO1/2